MSLTKFIHKISEEKIAGRIKYFYGYNELKEKYRSIGNIVFSEDLEKNTEILELLDISGKILMFGDPGTGKTSLAYYIANCFLDKEAVESYKLSIPDLIQSDLGSTTKNMNDAIKEIRKLSEKENMILILDELDRISVARNNSDEISELKRTLIEFLDFLDEVNYKHKILIIGITNSLDLLDSALVRRFDFVDEIKASNEDLKLLFETLVKKLEIVYDFKNEEIELFLSKYNTGDKMKKYFKKMYLETEGQIEDIKMKLIFEMGGTREWVCH